MLGNMDGQDMEVYLEWDYVASWDSRERNITLDDFGEIQKIVGMYKTGNVSNLILLGYTKGIKGIKGIYC